MTKRCGRDRDFGPVPDVVVEPRIRRPTADAINRVLFTAAYTTAHTTRVAASDVDKRIRGRGGGVFDVRKFPIGTSGLFRADRESHNG